MGKWLAKFLDETSELRTDITDTLPALGTLSVVSVPDSGVLAEKLASQGDQRPVSLEQETVEEPTPQPPLSPGWLVAYRDMTGKLRGGSDEREHGTVAECRWKGNEWVIALTDGEFLPARIIRAVSRVNADGRIVEAWTVASHGLDGRKPAEWERQDSIPSSGPKGTS